jgi:hypothetical protein
MKLAAIAIAALFGLGISGSAGAFTLDSHSLQNPDGTAKFQDPEAGLTGEGGKLPGSDKSGFSFHFSGGGSTSSGSNSLFAPSANGAFSSPFAGPSNLDYALGYRH